MSPKDPAPLALTFDHSLEERKVGLIFNLYLDPADQDYLAARWAFDNGLFQSFYMSAAQALEKYLKAALLLQDEPTLLYGHDLVRLYEAVRKFDTHGCLPESLDLPETTAMGRDAWQGKPTSLFADYLRKYGSPDNRYAFYGTFVNGPVLHVLDIICHALRRLMRRANFVDGDIFELRNARAFGTDRITAPHDWMLDPHALLERLFIGRYQVGEGAGLRQAFLNMNMAFTQERKPDERSFGGQHFHGSPLHNALVRLRELDPSPEHGAIVDQLRLWARSRIQMSKPIRAQLGYSKDGE